MTRHAQFGSSFDASMTQPIWVGNSEPTRPASSIPFRPKKPIVVPEQTGPLYFLKGRKGLFIADGQNLDQSARDLGFRLLWEMVVRRLVPACGWLAPHVVFAAHGQDDRRRRSDRFFQSGWIPHARMARVIRGERDANADDTFCCALGSLIERFRFDIVILGTGDTRLGLHAAEFIREMVLPAKRCPVVTLNVPGSNGRQLDADRTELIDHNIFVGLDCLRPLQRSA